MKTGRGKERAPIRGTEGENVIWGEGERERDNYILI